MKEKHGSARGSSDWLVERLGKAITRRRQYLKYREDHHGKLSRDWDEAPKDGEAKEDDKPEKLRRPSWPQPKQQRLSKRDKSWKRMD